MYKEVPEGIQATKMNDKFCKHLTDCILNDGNVLFYWCLAGQDENDEASNRCLVKLVENGSQLEDFHL